MLNKMLGILIGLLFLSGQCWAMTFSQPILIDGQVGAEFLKKNEGILVDKATSNSGHIVDEKITHRGNKTIHKKYYDKGIAQFGTGENALYAHYDMNEKDKKVYFGGKDKNNAFPLSVTTNFQGEKFYKINNDGDITLYLITCGGGMPGLDYYLLGRRKDGKWVKYIDSHEFSKNYFPTENVLGKEIVQEPAYNNLEIHGDTIIIGYYTNSLLTVPTKLGEFRFKWDEAAQWFGIEQVVY